MNHEERSMATMVSFVPGPYLARIGETDEATSTSILDITPLTIYLTRFINTPGLTDDIREEWQVYTDGEPTPNLDRAHSFPFRTLRVEALSKNSEPGRWVTLEINPRQEISITELPQDTSDRYEVIFGISGLPPVNPSVATSQMNLIPEIVAGVSLWVGQGTAVALLDRKGNAVAYSDVGANNVWTNGANTGTRIDYCTHNLGTIFLSHVDQDHWTGARLSKDMRRATWIMPAQKMRPGTAGFFARHAIRILRLTHTPTPITSQTGHQTLSLHFGTGSSSNHSGIILTVSNTVTGKILIQPGDCAYTRMPSSVPTGCDVLIAPHHGAHTENQQPTISPINNASRIIYSADPSRKPYEHPRQTALSSNAVKGWTFTKGAPKCTRGTAAYGKAFFSNSTHSRLTGYLTKNFAPTPGNPVMRSIGFILGQGVTNSIFDHLTSTHNEQIIQ